MMDLVTRQTHPVTRSKLLELEDAIREMPQVELETLHHFAPGVYIRELRIPAGVVLTGKIHRKELFNILVSGTIRVTCGDEAEEMTGLHIFKSGVGSKKAIYAITDAILMNTHPTDLTDLAEIEAEFIAPDFEALEEDV